MGLRLGRLRLYAGGWAGVPAQQEQVEQDKTIPTGATASVIAHLSLLALLVLLSEVHPHSPATEPVEVNIVTPEEAASVAPQEAAPDKAKPEPQDKPEPQLALPDHPAVKQSPLATEAPAPAAPKPASATQPAAKPQAAKAEPKAAAATPPAVAPPAAAPPAPVAPPPVSSSPPASTGYKLAEPDLSVKYNVILGLPMDAPPPAKAGKSEDGFDEATSNADIASSIIAEFRRYLKSCSKRPASVQPSDNITVKLRVAMTQDGRLAADPIVGGGSANPKAIELLQSAIAGLKQCQPYKMLPADRYGEWKVLDLDFTPKDFSG
jgi:outer membrane biosynthesis protein TonB